MNTGGGPSSRSIPKSPRGRSGSDVQFIGPNGQVVRNLLVWCDNAPSVKQNPELMFVQCVVLPGSTRDSVKLRQIEPKGSENDEFVTKPTHIWNCNSFGLPEECLKYRDIGLLAHQDVPAVLDFLKSRWTQRSIYTTADPLLVAINPFRDLKNCTTEDIERYKQCPDVHALPPHVFGVARAALDNLFGVQKSQSIVVTGESGAGKTEATKHCMRYLAFSNKMGSDSRIQDAVMAANPVLEAFGNAKTIMNLNSSRFGRFMQLAVAKGGGILGGKIQGFLLEKVRVISLQANERSFHIFYQLIKGATPEEKVKFKLRNCEWYRSLQHPSGGCYDVPGVDDKADYGEIKQSFSAMGFTTDETQDVLSIVSGILLLSNVQFDGALIDGVDDAAVLDSQSKTILREACDLMFLDGNYAQVEQGMESSVKQFGKDFITTRLKRKEAITACQSLARSVYNQLFKWIISRLNTLIELDHVDLFIGMLDIFGFEIFEQNSLEQLLINITNEFLQRNFIKIIFEKESKLYRDEGISTRDLVFTDNSEVVECLIGKKCSVFALLEDACVTRGGTDAALYSNMNQFLTDRESYRQTTTGAKALRFVIVHTVADIEYSAMGFVDKNSDYLKPELVEAAKGSHSSMMREMFEDIEVVRGSLGKGQLIASQFSLQLDEMMSIITNTESHFIRCVKPNENRSPTEWSNRRVMSQLQSLSILEALQLKKLGFSWRRCFRDFVKQFRFLNLAFDAEMEKAKDLETERNIADRMIKHMIKIHNKGEFVEGKDWQFGKTMIFMTSEAARQSLILQRQALEEWVPTVALIEALYRKQLLKRNIQKHENSLIRVQASIRRYLDCSPTN